MNISVGISELAAGNPKDAADEPDAEADCGSGEQMSGHAGGQQRRVLKRKGGLP